MQYALARRIPTHPTIPALLKYLPSVEIRKLDCLELGGLVRWQINYYNANDKPPS